MFPRSITPQGEHIFFRQLLLAHDADAQTNLERAVRQPEQIQYNSFSADQHMKPFSSCLRHQALMCVYVQSSNVNYVPEDE
jgi:hypothetical protein